MKHKTIFLFYMIFAGLALQSQTGLAIDIQHTRLDLDIEKSTQSLQAEARIRFRCVERCDSFTLFLQGLQIDSVNVPYRYQHDSILTFYWPSTLEAGSDDSLFIRYHGHPAKDASGWGGFYFQGVFAFNLGVGFAADPHPFGRIWFPCKDDFTDRSTFEFHIKTDPADRALCNGLPAGSTTTPDGKVIWHWRMDDPIVSYLASVAVAPYRPAIQNYQGQSRNFPVWYGGRAQDTAKMKKSFQHLFDAIGIFETAYGSQPFAKVGYALVPFSGGAMEHAGNIAFPLTAANGSTQFESLMVHELSHHWWGDWVTCANAGEMWLNEGWASWSEFLFLEKEYGREKYDDAIFRNRKKVIYRAHKDDQGYRAIQGTPHDYTYGTTVYDKGADVIHSLRGYMGDEDFFHCIKAYLKEQAWGNSESVGFRDFLSECSGKNMDDFFESFVFNPGWAQFSIDSTWIVPEGPLYHTYLWIRQRLHHAPAYFHNVPLTIHFFGPEGQTYSRKAVLPGACSALSIKLPFKPDLIVLNKDNTISSATFHDLLRLKENANNLETRADFTFNRVEFNSDSIMLSVAHHLVRPDREGVPRGIRISSTHYWQLDGIFPEGTLINGEVHFDGNDQNNPYDLDKDLTEGSEDSMVILYRPGAGSSWEIWENSQLVTLGKTDKTGSISILEMKKGEYALGVRESGYTDSLKSEIPDHCDEVYLGLKAQYMPKAIRILSVYPNPANDSITIEGTQGMETLIITDMQGKVILSQKLPGWEEYKFSVKSLAEGSYVITIKSKGMVTASGRFIISR